MTKRRRLLLIITVLFGALLAFHFAPPTERKPPTHQANRLAGWFGIEWVMEPLPKVFSPKYRDLAKTLIDNQINDAYFYVSYLKPGDFFNPTFDHAADFVTWIHKVAPDTRILAWIGVPISITQPDGTFVANRLASADIRQKIADFAASLVTDYGFDGVHLNAELAINDDLALIETLKTVRAALPAGAYFSIATHALRPEEIVTWVPYPILAHHWSPEYLLRAAEHVDQIVVMAYDSGLPSPLDYRNWTAYQTKKAAEVLADLPVELLIGVSASAEWTTSHQTQAEYLENAVAGVLQGLRESPVQPDGLAVYAAWEMDYQRWLALARQYDWSWLVRGLEGG
jgi:hypothetical protein